MRVIIAGSRGITDAARLDRAIRASEFPISYVISGDADGVDRMGVAWAKRQDPKIPVLIMPADWDALGKRAGMVRNCAMAKEADGLIAIWDGVSAGTRHMITEAVSKGLHHYIDAACGRCGGFVDVAIYRFVQPAGPLDQIRATCRSCITRSGGDVTFFDVFKMWGNHSLHVTERRNKIETPRTPPAPPPRKVMPVPKFGDKAAALKEYKQWRQLPPEERQETLFGQSC